MTPDTPDTLVTADALAWLGRAPEVPGEWFLHPSSLHGVRHTQRVHIHVQRLTRALRSNEPDARLALCAALWHDIGRRHDGWDPSHGFNGAARAARLGLTRALTPADAEIVLFAVRYHSCPDEEGDAQAGRQPMPERAIRALRLLKDADALDRVRLTPWEAADPNQLRHPETIAMLAFAQELYRASER